MEKILILNTDTSSFEKFINNNMRNTNIDVYEPLKDRFIKNTLTNKIIKKLSKCSPILYYFLLNSCYLIKLKEYKKIIIFDSAVSEILLKTLYRYSNAKLYTWMWNTEDSDFPKFKKYSSIYSFDWGNCELFK